MNYLAAATLLREELDEEALALEVARKGAALPLPAPDRMESREAHGQLAALLRDWATRPKRAGPRPAHERSR